MVHLKQYAKGELKDYARVKSIKWKGQVYDEDRIDYWDHPWEIEAYGRERGLYIRFYGLSKNEKQGLTKNTIQSILNKVGRYTVQQYDQYKQYGEYDGRFCKTQADARQQVARSSYCRT